MTWPALWSRDGAPLPRWAPLTSSRRERIVIVGAGLAGLGLARALRALGADPLVVDARGLAEGASGRNAGFVLRTHVTEYASLRARLGPSVARALLAAASENHARIVEGMTGDPSGHRASGSLMLATGAEAPTLAEAHRALSEDGVRVAEVAVPAALRGFDAALRVQDDGEVNPARLVAALASGVRGARFDARRIDDAGVTDGTLAIDADHVVLATNAWTARLVPALGRVITPQRAQMLSTEPLPLALDTPCYAGLGFDDFRQRADGRVLLGGRRHLFLEQERTVEEDTTDAVQAALDAYLAQHLPFTLGARVEARWSGIMAFTPDGLPVAGRMHGVRGRPWILGGWTGHGLGLALEVSARLAGAIVGASRADDALLSALDPARFSGMFAGE